MARLFNNSHTIDSPQRAAALSVVLAFFRTCISFAPRALSAFALIGAPVMSDAAKYGLTRIGFVTDPKERR